jgi:hypothetical protein
MTLHPKGQWKKAIATSSTVMMGRVSGVSHHPSGLFVTGWEING